MNPNAQHREYSGIHSLRALSAIGICIMHVHGNVPQKPTGFFYDNVLSIFPDLVFLFMMISAFSMCCGYYDRVSRGEITPAEFYAKRFSKIWPFFAILNLLGLVVNPYIETLYEIFANLTLCFGLLPNAYISVIGVGWTLGVIFVFYLLFPFFCFLFANKRRAWLSMLAAIVMHYLCVVYFFDKEHVAVSFHGRVNIVYSAVYFFAGGLVWLYREKLVKISKWLWLPALGGLVLSFWNQSVLHIVFLLLLICSIGYEGVLVNNKIIKFLSNISMEFYLSHMVVFRIIEKTGMFQKITSPHVTYWITAVLTVAGTVAFSVVVQRGIVFVKAFLKNKSRHGVQL